MMMKNLIQPLIYGSYTYPDNSVYHGEWNLEGMKHGVGILILSSGLKYCGHFQRNYFSGLGYLQFDYHPSNASSSSWYLGEFCNGWFHGQGIYQDQDRQFIGHFRAGKMFGIGRFSLLNQGSFYDGAFREYIMINWSDTDVYQVINNVYKMAKLFQVDIEEIDSDLTNESECSLDDYQTDTFE